MRLSMALWADASRTRPKRRRCAETGPCVPLKQRSDLLLSHPGLAVVSRLSGARADSCSGNKANPVPTSSCSLTAFSFLRNLGSRKKLGRDPEGRKLALARHNRAFRTCFGIEHWKSGVTTALRKTRYYGGTSLITGRSISPSCSVVNPAKDAHFVCNFSCKRRREMRRWAGRPEVLPKVPSTSGAGT